ncbi:MAG: VWA domain-containing protein [Desulfobacterales bacterium]|jgi:hypothetical protein
MKLDDTIITPRHCGTGMIENIVRFSNLLREIGVSVSLPAILDAIKGVPLIDISDLGAFQCLLRANLVCRKDDIPKFDRLFCAYWLPKHPSRTSIPAETKSQDEEQTAATSLFNNITEFKSPLDASGEAGRPGTLRYSPDTLSKQGEPIELGFAQSQALYESISNLLQSLANRMSRRFKYSIRGREISLRRILRKNMQFGGELILLDFKKKKAKKKRVIFLCDVSGSMNIYTLLILQFVHALKRIDRMTEIFFFSTDLTKGTHLFQEGDFTSAISKLPQVISDWSGGTRIGYCLQRFNEVYGKQLLSGKSIVMIFSDGWDRGDVEVLEEQLTTLKRKTYKIIWLNPLSGARDYQPICQGMSAALPFLDYFLPMAKPQDLRILGRTLETIMV